MQHEAKIAMESALELMLKAGWVQSFAHNVENNYAVRWTPLGTGKIDTLVGLMRELGDLDDCSWTGVGFLARLRSMVKE